MRMARGPWIILEQYSGENLGTRFFPANDVNSAGLWVGKANGVPISFLEPWQRKAGKADREIVGQG